MLYPFFPMKSRNERVHKMSPALGMFLALGQTYKKNLSVFDLGHFSEQVPLQPNLGQKYPHSKITYHCTVSDPCPKNDWGPLFQNAVWKECLTMQLWSLFDNLSKYCVSCWCWTSLNNFPVQVQGSASWLRIFCWQLQICNNILRPSRNVYEVRSLEFCFFR